MIGDNAAMSRLIRALAACLVATFAYLTGAVQAQQSVPWVLVDTPAMKLSVMRGEVL